MVPNIKPLKLLQSKNQLKRNARRNQWGIQQLIHQRESLANEVKAFRKQGKSVGEEIVRDFWSTVAGELQIT